jgi:hypothetical protein
MDIAGAKALKERLGHNGKAPDRAAQVDVREGAPPVYQYLGVSEAPAVEPADVEEPTPPRGRFVWLRLLSRPAR